MRKEYSWKTTMGQKVLEFCRTLTWDHPELKLLIGLLAEQVGRLLALDAQFSTGQLTFTGATQQKRRMRRKVHEEFLVHLNRIATAHLGSQPELQSRFRIPSPNLGNHKFLAAARNILQDATTHRELFLRYDMAPDFLEQFQAALDSYEQAPQAAVVGLTTRAGATAEQGAEVKELMVTVNRLNALIRNHYRGDLETLTAWKVIRKIPWERPPRPAPPAREHPAA